MSQHQSIAKKDNRYKSIEYRFELQFFVSWFNDYYFHSQNHDKFNSKKYQFFIFSNKSYKIMNLNEKIAQIFKHE